MNCFVFFLNAAAWQRVLDELIVSKLLEGGPFTTWVAFLSRLERLEWINSNNLVLLASDLDPGESFDAPATPGQQATAGTARRRGRAHTPATPAVAAQPAIPGPPDMPSHGWCSAATVGLC